MKRMIIGILFIVLSQLLQLNGCNVLQKQKKTVLWRMDEHPVPAEEDCLPEGTVPIQQGYEPVSQERYPEISFEPETFLEETTLEQLPEPEEVYQETLTELLPETEKTGEETAVLLPDEPESPFSEPDISTWPSVQSGISLEPTPEFSENISGGPAPDLYSEPQRETAVSFNPQAEQPLTEEKQMEVSPEIQTEPLHVHIWVPVYSYVHHDAVYQHHDADYQIETVTEKQLVQDAYDEPAYELHSFCSECGADITWEDPIDHSMDKHDGTSGWSDIPVQVDTIHHEAEYNEVSHETYVLICEAYEELVSEAWDEECVTGYVCRDCGASQ